MTWKIWITLVMIAMSGMMGIDIHLPSLPYIVHAFHTSKSLAQQSVVIFLLGIGLSSLFYGPLSDHYGRKPIVTFALIVATLSSLSTWWVNSINSFLLIRLLQGIGAGGCLGLTRTILADTLTGEALAIKGSYFSLSLSLAPLLAPVIGGYIQHHFNWRVNFIVLSSFFAVSLFSFIIFCPETNYHKSKQDFSLSHLFPAYKPILLNNVFLSMSIISGLSIGSTIVYATLSPFIFQVQFGLTPIMYGWLMLLTSIGGLLGRFICPFLIKKYGSVVCLWLGFSLLLCAGFFLLFTSIIDIVGIHMIMAAAIITLISRSIIMPNIISSAFQFFPHSRGAASALYGSLQMLVSFACGGLVSVFTHDGVIVLAVAYTLLGLLSLVMFSRV